MSSPVQDLANDWDFLEFWADPTAWPPYALILLGKNSGVCQIVDPAAGYQTQITCASYEEAKLWLLEDEYERIEGRLVASEV